MTTRKALVFAFLLCLAVPLIVAAQTPKIEGTYKVTVNYGQTLAEMIAAGNYDWQNTDIIAEHFPIPPAKRGKEEVEIELVHLNRYAESDEVLRELDKMGLRPATLPELLAFGAAYPNKRREFPIAALGSVGAEQVAYFYKNADGHGLGLRWWSGGWGPGCRFAAVRLGSS